MNPRELSFEEFIKDTRLMEGWEAANVKAELMGNSIHPAMWRVRVYSENGKGNENPVGAVRDLASIDGEWKFVFWGTTKTNITYLWSAWRVIVTKP